MITNQQELLNAFKGEELRSFDGHNYYDVKLVAWSDLLWLKPPNYRKEGDDLIWDWDHLIVVIYFPNK